MSIENILMTENEYFLFDVINDDSENPLEWEINTRIGKLIPDTEAHCIVRAKMIDANKVVTDCLINISLPERIVDFVIYKYDNELICKQLYELQDSDVIPAIASEAIGVYELYYSKNRPDIGINILKQGLKVASNPSVIAEDLGYILRDENRYKEAIDAFRFQKIMEYQIFIFIRNFETFIIRSVIRKK
jgi:hypothetical protein